MKGDSVNNQNESTEKPWPSVLQIANSDEFQQSVAVAQLAVKLCELKRAGLKTELLKGAETPEKSLNEAWQLVLSARACVLRSQTNNEYLQGKGGSDEAVEEVVGRILRKSYVAFKKLCDPEHKGDSTPIQLFDAESGTRIKVKWKVYTTERAFENLFGAYWRGIREQHKREFSLDPEHYDKRRTEAELADVRSQIKTREDALHGANADERKRLIKEIEVLGEKRMDLEQRKHLVDLVNDDDAWEKRGQSVLTSWKRDGVPPNDFRALVRFRREHDKRAANLKPKPKRKHRQQLKRVRTRAAEL